MCISPLLSHRLSELFAGVVLTAGRSSRMGAPKALLTLGGVTFVRRIVDAMVEGGCWPVVVVASAGADEEAGRRILAEADAAGAMTVINPDPDSQQIDSLRVALQSLPPGIEGIVTAPVDSPGATPEVIAALLASVRAGATITMPSFQGRRGHPVAFGAVVLPELLAGDLPEGARTVIRRRESAVVELPVDDPGVLLDVDTPQDYARLREGCE